uniref:Ig-like domain-containing protein n=1 Tax=Strigamia maritima TaxID=126957 RepID=T1J9F1_STRMM
MNCKYLCFLKYMLFFNLVTASQENFKGPSFTTEPPSQVDFSNSTGAKIECSATGVPAPIVTWVRADGSTVSDVAKLRQVLRGGTLKFYPFFAEDYRQDIHAVVYKCVATNPVGTIVSRDVKVRGEISKNDKKSPTLL